MIAITTLVNLTIFGSPNSKLLCVDKPEQLQELECGAGSFGVLSPDASVVYFH